MSTKIIERHKDHRAIAELLGIFPVTAILGPRQVGKTTLAKTFKPKHIFDLENPRDFALLDNPQLALEKLEGLIMIDEVQRKAELFPLLRYLVDNNPKQRYLILGSASSSLKQQSGESLAGRIGYYYLTGLNLIETGKETMDTLWLRGGFPRSFLMDSDSQSMIWRANFISTFLERDLNLLGVSVPPSVMYRFWTMLSHYHGQSINYSELARSFGISDKTAKLYISVLEDTFMVRQLMPWHANLGKRLVKSPKIYLRDSGIFHALQSINTIQELRSNPKIGASWEGFAMEELISHVEKRDSEVFFYATHGGVEVDLYWQHQGKRIGAEFKYTDAPGTTKSMQQAISDLNLDELWVIYPGNRKYQLTDKITVMPLTEIA
ncbi:MAG: ATP-binding protein [Lewinellaceae bacterium]|nr:ATP-binding protein [Saprospiraceae bacterium]MCB9344636.1 ATP-binding protein [Lewinellaceae bacterium]